MREFLARAPIAVVLIFLLIYGGYRLRSDQGVTIDGVAFLAAGLVMLGTWLTLEILRYADRRTGSEEDKDDDAEK